MIFFQLCRGSWWLATLFCVWTMYPWWTLCKILVCHFDVWAFVYKMYRSVPSTSNVQNTFQSFLRVCLLVVILSLAWIKFPFFFLCMLNPYTESHVWLFVTLWIVAHQAPLSVGFSRQEYWSGLPFPPPGDLPNTGIKAAWLMPTCMGRWVLYY